MRDCVCPPRFLLFTVPVKIVVYGSMRMMYPLLNFLVDDWGITRLEMSYLLAAGEFAGIPAGFISTLADYYGNRLFGVGSFILFFLSGLSMLLPPIFAVLLVFRILIQVSGSVYLISLQSTLFTMYVDRVGWVTGISETSWALSMLVLMPILSVLYSAFGWRAPFVCVSVLSFFLAVEVFIDFPTDSRNRRLDSLSTDNDISDGMRGREEVNVGKRSIEDNGELIREEEEDEERQDVQHVGSNHASDDQVSDVNMVKKMGGKEKERERNHGCAGTLVQVVRFILSTRYWYCLVAPGPLLFNVASFFFNLSGNLVFIGLTNWLQETHGVQEKEMGAITFAIGVAELVGSVAVIFASAKFGLYRGQYLTGGLMVVFQIGFFFGQDNYIFGLLMSLLTLTAAEYLIVSELAIIGMFLKEAYRTTVIGLNVQCHFLGRAVGALVAEHLWVWTGVNSVIISSILAIVTCMVFTALAQKFLPEGAEGNSHGDTTPENKSTAGEEDDNNSEDRTVHAIPSVELTAT